MDANRIAFSSDVDMARDTCIRETGKNFKYDRHLDEYERCYLELLRKKEASKAKIRLASPQLKYRGYLIQRLTVVSEEMDLGSKVLHASIRLLDHFMDAHDINPDRLLPVAFSCLFIATKFEYEGRKLPQFRQICEVADLEPMPNELLLSFELSILKNVEWDLCTPNVSTFLEFFGQYSVSPKDEVDWIRMKNNVLYLPFVKNNSLTMHMNKKLAAFLSITLLDVQFTQIVPSLLASACLLAARISIGLEAWPPHLEYLTSYSFYHIESISTRLRKMWDRHNTQYKRRCSSTVSTDDEDLGYGSGKSSPENNAKRFKST